MREKISKEKVQLNIKIYLRSRCVSSGECFKKIVNIFTDNFCTTFWTVMAKFKISSLFLTYLLILAVAAHGKWDQIVANSANEDISWKIEEKSKISVTSCVKWK